MPSVSNPNKVEKSTLSDPHQEPLSKVQLLVDKKIRNLEKRKSRLEQYRAEAKSGKELNLDQKKAVKRYDEVTEMLDFFREFQKNVQSIFADHAKQMKKLARKERPTRDPKEIERLRLVFQFQDLLGSLNADVKNDFLNGTNGATQITEEKLQHLEEFSKLIDSEKNKVDETSNKPHIKTAERYLALVEGVRSDAFKGTSYKELKETLTSINECGYFNVSVQKSVSINLGTSAVSKSSLSSATSQPQQQPQVAESGNISRVTDVEEISRPNFESSPIQPTVPSDSQIPSKSDISGGNKYHQSQQPQHQNKPRNSNSNQPGMNEMLSNVGGPGSVSNNTVTAAPNSYNFLQESRLEMENAPHMDPAVVAMAPVAGTYSTPYGNNQSVEALAAQFASTGIPPMSSVTNNMTKGVTTYENAGPTHQPIPTQTFTNQRFTAMMTGGTFVQPVPIANPSLLGLPVQLTGQSLASHPSGTNEQMTQNQPNNDNNQSHGMSIGNMSQNMSGYGPEANFTQYQASHHHDNSNTRINQGPSRDKQLYQGDDNAAQGGYGSNYGRFRRGGGRGGGGDRNAGPPRSNKYNSVNGYSSRGRGGGSGIRSSGKPQDKPKNVTDNRNVSNQWS